MTEETPTTTATTQEQSVDPAPDLGYGPQISDDTEGDDNGSDIGKDDNNDDDNSDDSDNDAPSRRGIQRRMSNLPDRGLGERFSMRIPANNDAVYTAAETHGHGHWKVEVLHFLHSNKVQFAFMILLCLDVLILFTELFLQATYPLCDVIERDAISCCPADSVVEAWNATGFSNGTDTTSDHGAAEHLRRFLSGGGDDESHHNLCDYPGIESNIHDATCDPHKWQVVHNVEKVLFIFTVTILSIFMAELTTMVVVLGKAFFRQFFYVLDFFIVLTSLVLELTFHFVHKDLLATAIGLIIFARLWRFVRIGHGLIEVTAEYAHQDKEALMDYAEILEGLLLDNGMDLPKASKRVRTIKKSLHDDEHTPSGHSKK